MNDPRPDPVTTHQLFAHDRVAAGYASARPFLHREVFARVVELIRPTRSLHRALDVGCGTGLSSVALLDLAREVTAVDASVPMLLRATRAARVRYLASSAEELPFRSGSFDLVAACGSIDWVDRARFLPRAAELLVGGGWLTPVDFGDTGRSPELPALERWHKEVFQRAFPFPPAGDPIVTGAEARRFGFTEPKHHTFESPCTFTAAQYSDFLMTESNIVAAVEYGERSAGEIRAWLEAQLTRLFGRGSHAVAFSGYIQVLQKL
jgi:SAM-dependent methyltransferase